TGLQIGEELRNLIAFQHFLQYLSAMLIYAVHGKNAFRQIDAK
ncbi:MAG: hypothetical protein QOG58_91, partial [Caballeronia sp.]|nr:hypothetical protein [Caballeronia sp.]